MKYFLALIIGLAAIGIGYVIITILKHTNESAARACFLSIREPLASSLKELPIAAGGQIESWQELQGANALVLIGKSLGTAADCGSADYLKKGEDPWGNRLQVFFRTVPQLSVKIVSPGPDGMLNTADDINVQSD